MLEASEVERLLSAHQVGEWGEWHWAKGDEAVAVDGLGAVEVVDVEGNQEGGGEYSHIVFRVIYPDGAVHFYKMEGCYQSFDGCEWDGPLSEVIPTQKTVTIYASI